jgi:uncharacterized damage-inducible protein DinB
MTFITSLLAEFDHEMQTTRSLLERVPFEKSSWRPHNKSMSLGDLASHIANLAGYGAMIVEVDQIDITTHGPQSAHQTREEMLQTFDANVVKSRTALGSLGDDKLQTSWTLRAGDQVIFDLPRPAVIRSMLMNHMIHHRGQLSVYLRENDVPLPSIYGPTADT